MSMPKSMTINCSECGTPISVTVFQSVITDFEKDIAEKIISGDLFNAKCSKCGSVSHLEYDMLYHDMKHMAMIWVVHKEAPDYAKRVAETRSSNLIPYKTTRIVEDMNALREKVACLENDRDDRIIELCKVFTACRLLEKRPEFNFKKAFYTAFDGKEFIFLYDDEGNELTCEFPDKAYDYLKDLYFNSAYAKEFDDNYAKIDYEWAEQIFSPLVDGEAKATETNERSDTEVKNDYQDDSKNIFCRKCGSELSEDSLFCDKCDTKVTVQQEEPSVRQESATSATNQQSRSANSSNVMKSEESEYLNQVNIGQELNEALQKRIVTTKATEKKKKFIKTAVILAIVAVVVALIINSAAESAHNGELRNFAIGTMNDDYTNVYADIVSMEPEYFVYTSYNNSPYDLSEIVCKCITVEGKTIWATIDIWEYPGGSSIEEHNEPQYYSKTNPKRLIGRVTTAGQVMDELEDKIGNIFVLDVTENVSK